MASDTKLVSIGISEVSAIVVLVILEPQPRRTFGGCAICQSDSVSLFDDCSAFREEGDHLNIAAVVRQLVVWCADEEKWPGTRLGLPTSPRPLSLAEASFDTEGRHQLLIET